jgi:hypothetical protein
VILKGTGCEDVEWIYLALSIEVSCWFCEHGNKPTVSVIGGKFLKNRATTICLRMILFYELRSEMLLLLTDFMWPLELNKLNPPFACCQSGDAGS